MSYVLVQALAVGVVQFCALLGVLNNVSRYLVPDVSRHRISSIFKVTNCLLTPHNIPEECMPHTSPTRTVPAET